MAGFFLPTPCSKNACKSGVAKAHQFVNKKSADRAEFALAVCVDFHDCTYYAMKIIAKVCLEEQASTLRILAIFR